MKLKRSEISAIVTFHAEGDIATRMLDGLLLVRRFTEASGISVSIVAVLDCATSETIEKVKLHPIFGINDSIIEVENKDLGLSRNSGVKHSTGQYIAILDGDDYYSENWLRDAYRIAKRGQGRVIVHPKTTVTFGDVFAVIDLLDMGREEVASACFFSCHPWNSCSFGHRSIYEMHPYHETQAAQTGFGYEDWHWNLELVSNGIKHVCADSATLFYRRKPTSMLSSMQKEKATLRPSSFFINKENFRPIAKNITLQSRIGSKKIRQALSSSWTSAFRPVRGLSPTKYRDAILGFSERINSKILNRNATQTIGLLPKAAVDSLRQLASIEGSLDPTREFINKFHIYKNKLDPKLGLAWGRILDAIDQPNSYTDMVLADSVDADCRKKILELATKQNRKILSIAYVQLASDISRHTNVFSLSLNEIGTDLVDDEIDSLVSRVIMQSSATLHVARESKANSIVIKYNRQINSLGIRVGIF